LDTSALAIESDEEIEVYEEIIDEGSYLEEEILEESWVSVIPDDLSLATFLNDSKGSLSSLGGGQEVETSPAEEVKENASGITAGTAAATQADREPQDADPSREPTVLDTKSSQSPTEAAATPSQHDDDAKPIADLEPQDADASREPTVLDTKSSQPPTEAAATPSQHDDDAKPIADLEPQDANASREPTVLDTKSSQPPTETAATPLQHDDDAKPIETVEKTRPFLLPAPPSFDEDDNPSPAADRGATSTEVKPQNAFIKRPTSLRLPSPPSFDDGVQETQSDKEKKFSPQYAGAATDLKSTAASPKKEAVGSPASSGSDKDNKKKKGKLKQIGTFMFGGKKKK
jgi:hypothetical protein